MGRSALAWLTIAAVLSASSVARPQGGGVAGGVYLDADKVLRWKESASGAAARKLAKAKNRAVDAELAYVSLPRLFAEYEKLVKNGRPVPTEIATLGGMTRLQYVFAYPNEKDLVIAGPVEEVDDSDTYRPVGKSSGRPTLRLDDLLVCLATLGPGKKPAVFGCSLDMPEGGLGRMQQAAQQIGAVSGGNNTAVSRKLAEAVGFQNVRLFGAPADTNAAYVCIEADYVLKRLSQGKMPSPVKEVKSFVALMRPGPDSAYNRWWFVPNYDPLLVGEDGLSFELRSKGLTVKCSAAQATDDAQAGPGATKFAELVSAHFDGLQQSIPSFADLTNISDLTVLAALCRTEKLAEKTQWNVANVGTPECPYRKRDTPREVESVAAYKRTGRTVTVAVGGVTFDADDAVRSRTKQKAEAFANKAKRPKSGWLMKPETAPGG